MNKPLRILCVCQLGIGSSVMLKLNIEKAEKELDIKPVYDAKTAIIKTTEWYKEYYNNKTDMISYTKKQIEDFIKEAQSKDLNWSK